MKPARTKLGATTKLTSIASPDDDVPMEEGEEDMNSDKAVKEDNSTSNFVVITNIRNKVNNIV